MKRVVGGLVWVSASTALIGFFLPWAAIDLREPSAVRQLREMARLRGTVGGLTRDLSRITVQVRRGAETITGELPKLSDIPKEVSGVQIPRLANQENAKVAMALIELLTRQRQHIGAKSYAVYLVPGLALVFSLLLTVLGGRKVVTIGTLILCAAIAGGGFWKLLTTNTKTLFIAITIGRGLWLSLWAYVGLALAACLGLIVGSPRARPAR